MPVRLASPQGVTGLTEMITNPIYATGIGLLLYGQKQHEAGAIAAPTSAGQHQGFMSRIKAWVARNF